VPIAALLLASGPALGRLAVRASGAGLILAAVVFSWFAVPAEYGLGGVYSVICFVLMPHSKTLDRDLKDLGLDASYQRCIGTYSYSEGGPFQDPQFRREFASRTSHGRLGWFLLCHPAYAYRAVRYSLDFAGRQRPGMGNFDRSTQVPPYTESQAFAFWSDFKKHAFENWGSRYLFYFLTICGALCAALLWRQPRFVPAGACLCAMALLSLCIGSFADALEVTRHFFLFNALVDVALVSTVIAMLPTRTPCGVAATSACCAMATELGKGTA
jgi:hypothetical protein